MKEPLLRGLPPPEAAETATQTGLRKIVESIYGATTTLALPGLDIGRSYLGTARDFAFGGDLVDVFHSGDGRTALAVVDITGHGVAAALHAGLIKHALRAYAAQGSTVLHAVRALNHLCIENSAFDGTEDLFATIFYGVIDRDRRTFTYVSAGHRTAFLIDAFRTIALEASAPIIGLLDDPREFSARTIALGSGALIAIVTDGFTEARNGNGKFLGSSALSDVVLAEPGRSAQQCAEAITQRAYRYTQAETRDDIAALVVKIVNAGQAPHAGGNAADTSARASRQRIVAHSARSSAPDHRTREIRSKTFDALPSVRIGQPSS